MSLRVIAGTARGMKLRPVPGNRTRPVMDRVKEALFSILGSEIQGLNFLDLFSGTGSVGIEALSRGAAHAHFNDLDRQAIKTIHQNLAHTGLKPKARVTRRHALDLIARGPERHFHYVYVAPPQYLGIWLKTLAALNSNPAWRRRNSRVIVQIDPTEFDSERRFDCLEETDQRKYGRTLLVFYQFAEAADAN
ncbi:MAG: 16S rRNA (guanine(966)-N(2))-methyltransferase RsmD [Chloroflexota bacterium]|nr:16S rRNA (guanine(966)-N(2))-methyltransferase RsmD [Chloroflexota bacterium]MDE2909484.1 16S rRNA (guanine(966)-N(2))-methyltransferase RsmD [Chloroflexota bacterium]